MPKTLIEVETLRRLRDPSADYQSGWAAGQENMRERAVEKMKDIAQIHSVSLFRDEALGHADHIGNLKLEEPGG